jgi:hypothetical protein
MGLLSDLFSWEETLVTSNIDDFMKIKYELESKGVKFKTKVKVSDLHRNFYAIDNCTTYHLYVKKTK